MTVNLHPHRPRGASFVSTVRPTPSQRRAASTIALISLAVFALAAPFAKMQLAQVKAFLPIYQSALVVFDLITCVLLFGQYRMLRSRALLLLAAGYVFSALMAVAHALSFPGLFAPEGALGGGPQTTAWLYFMWHAGFPAFILAYALTPQDAQAPGGLSDTQAMLGSIGMAALWAAACVVFATSFHGWLPAIMSGHQDAPGKVVVAFVTWLIPICALVVLWRRRPHTVLDLWLMVVLCVWIADTALAGVLNHARFDVGWYAGRIYGLLANGFVLAVLLLESGSLYARLAKSNRLLGVALDETRRLNGDLEAFAGSLAHDLQQPLITIASFAQVIERTGVAEQHVPHLRKIIGATNTAREMIRALLEFARLGDAPVASMSVDLDTVVAQARSVAMAGAGADAASKSVEWNVAPLPRVQGDPALLLLAFVNLLSNAVKYSGTRERPAVGVDAQRDADGRWVVHVRDNGVGFDMDRAKRLFQPFERLHAQHEFAGTGMGLANVRRIVERHGGAITAQSRPGEGAVFSLVLPAAAAQHQASPRRAGEAMPGALGT